MSVSAPPPGFNQIKRITAYFLAHSHSLTLPSHKAPYSICLNWNTKCHFDVMTTANQLTACTNIHSYRNSEWLWSLGLTRLLSLCSVKSWSVTFPLTASSSNIWLYWLYCSAVSVSLWLRCKQTCFMLVYIGQFNAEISLNTGWTIISFWHKKYSQAPLKMETIKRKIQTVAHWSFQCN